MIRALLTTAAVAALIAPAARAADLTSCSAIAADAARLACYDQFAGRAAATPAKAAVIAEYDGNGTRNTRPFTAQGPWEVQWDTDGDIFQLYLMDANGQMVGVLANQMGPGSSSSYHARRGTYSFQVNAMGDWYIQVVPAN